MKNLFLASLAIFALSFTSHEANAAEHCIMIKGEPICFPILDHLPHHQFNAPKEKLENIE